MKGAKRLDGGELVVLGLGSNTGDSLSILRGAAASLSSLLYGMSVSSIYLTEPQDYNEQPSFYNAAVAGRFAFSPEKLLLEINKIEAYFGRNRANEIPKGPRALDIDILIFGMQSIEMETPNLTIPHKAIRERQFALVPLIEIVPDAVDPVTGKLFCDISAKLPPQGVKKLEERLWN